MDMSQSEPEPASLQDRYASTTTCFGCGPANRNGLRVKSRPEGDEVVADWQAQPHHEAFAGTINGGIIGTLLDCHSNWAATWALMQRDGLPRPPCTVTAELHVRFRKPTPSARPVRLRARAVSTEGNRATVEATLESGGEVTATCRAVFVAVGEGHPAYHRW
jgi:acyl-coenzyme A thioesterase PaaI-like protein